MGEVFIVRRGGGGGGAGATLVVTGEVTTPASTVTITNTTLGKTYTKTLDSAGKATFKGLKSGTWNITMTDGTRTVTDSIVIDTEYGKRLIYWDGNLYNKGNECVDVTGGWYASSGITKTSDYIQMYAQEWSDPIAITKQAIDLTNYNTLHFTTTWYKQYGGYFAVTKNYYTDGATARDNAAISASYAAVGEKTLDISSLTGNYYISISGHHASDSSGGDWHGLRVDRVWVTK